LGFPANLADPPSTGHERKGPIDEHFSSHWKILKCGVLSRCISNSTTYFITFSHSRPIPYRHGNMNSSPMESEQVEDQEEAVRPRSHRCSLCEREYKSKEALSRHRNTHSQKNTYVCHICQAVFYRKDLLARHDRIHGSPTESGSAPRARLRIAVACVSCRQQKIKCIGASPCSACLRSGTSCIRRGIRQKERANLPLILGNEAQESGVFGSPGDEDALPQAWEAQPNLAGLSSSPNGNYTSEIHPDLTC
jgi:hypothetical protein